MHPIWITHVSGRLGVANSKALELANVTQATPQPLGGVIRMENGEPNGVFEEALGMLTKLLPTTTLEQRMQLVRHADREYALLSTRFVWCAVLRRQMALLLYPARFSKKGKRDLRSGLMSISVSRAADVPQVFSYPLATGELRHGIVDYLLGERISVTLR